MIQLHLSMHKFTHTHAYSACTCYIYVSSHNVLFFVETERTVLEHVHLFENRSPAGRPGFLCPLHPPVCNLRAVTFCPLHPPVCNLRAVTLIPLFYIILLYLLSCSSSSSFTLCQVSVFSFSAFGLFSRLLVP